MWKMLSDELPPNGAPIVVGWDPSPFKRTGEKEICFTAVSRYDPDPATLGKWLWREYQTGAEMDWDDCQPTHWMPFPVFEADVVRALDAIALALSASHGLTVTDRADLGRKDWPVYVLDHANELALVDRVKSTLGFSNRNGP